jgi:hypothetical protein
MVLSRLTRMLRRGFAKPDHQWREEACASRSVRAHRSDSATIRSGFLACTDATCLQPGGTTRPTGGAPADHAALGVCYDRKASTV